MLNHKNTESLSFELSLVFILACAVPATVIFILAIQTSSGSLKEQIFSQLESVMEVIYLRQSRRLDFVSRSKRVNNCAT